MKRYLIPSIVTVIALLAMAYPAVAQVFPSLPQWKIDGSGNITQFTANTPVKVVGNLTVTGTCTGCGGGGGGSGVGTVSTSTIPVVGQLSYWTSNGFPSLLGSVATGTVSNGAGISVTAGQSVIGSGLTITNTGVTSLAATYPIQVSASTGSVTVSTAFGTTTSNTFAGTQTFTNSPVFSTLGAGTVNSTSGGTTYSSATTSVSNGTGIGFTGTAGALIGGSNLTITNTGVTSNVAGTGISVSGATGAVTITNTGVTSVIAGTGISVSGATGAVTITNTGSSGSAYPFPLAGNATSTLTQFNGGLTAYASSTIGNGTQTGGLTISGGATTTKNAYFGGNVLITADGSFPIYGTALSTDQIDSGGNQNQLLSINTFNNKSGTCAQSGFIANGDIPTASQDFTTFANTNSGWVGGGGCPDFTDPSNIKPLSTYIFQPTGDLANVIGTTTNFWSTGVPTGFKWYTASGATQSMVLTNTGALGIGLADPGSTLEVKATSTASTGFNTIDWDSSNNFLFGVRNDGHVGIGTTTPGAQLSVSTLAQQDGTLPLFSVASTTNTSLLRVFGNGNVDMSALTATTTVAGDLRVGPLTTNTGWNFIASTGRLVRGTVDVGGAVSIFSNTAGQASLGIQNNGVTNGGVILGVTLGNVLNGDVYGINVSGNNTGDMAFKVQENGNGRATFRMTSLGTGDDVVQENINGGDGWTEGLDFSDGHAYKISFGSVLGTNDYVTVRPNGNVGVGTSTPFSLLSVATSTSSSGATSLFAVASSTNATLFNVLGSGNVGVGTTSPYALLSVAGNLVVGAPSAGGTLGDLFLPKLGTAAGSFIAVDATGKVIATTSPTSSTNFWTSSAGNIYNNTGARVQFPAFDATSTTATSTITQSLTIGSASLAPLFQIGSTTPTYGYLPNDRLNIIDNRNDYAAGNNYNLSNGNCATADWTVANDLGSTALNFGDFGHTSSLFTGSGCANNPFTGFGANSTYIFDPSGNIDFAIGSSSTAQIRFFTGGYASTNQRMVITNQGYLGLGTTTPWAELSVSTSTQQSGLLPLVSVASSTNATLFAVFGNGSVGIGTSSPYASGLAISVASTTDKNLPIFSVVGLENAVVNAAQFIIDQWGRVLYYGDTPTLGSCGTSPSIVAPSNDVTGVIQAGGGILTDCTLIFAHPYPVGSNVQVFASIINSTVAIPISVNQVPGNVTQVDLHGSNLSSQELQYYVVVAKTK